MKAKKQTDTKRKGVDIDNSFEISKRRQRNRISQRASRERQWARIKELEELLAATSSEPHVRALSRKCEKLTEALLHCRKRLLAYAAAIQFTSNDIARVLECLGPQNDGNEKIQDEDTNNDGDDGNTPQEMNKDRGFPKADEGISDLQPDSVQIMNNKQTHSPEPISLNNETCGSESPEECVINFLPGTRGHMPTFSTACENGYRSELDPLPQDIPGFDSAFSPVGPALPEANTDNDGTGTQSYPGNSSEDELRALFTGRISPRPSAFVDLMPRQPQTLLRSLSYLSKHIIAVRSILIERYSLASESLMKKMALRTVKLLVKEALPETYPLFISAGGFRPIAMVLHYLIRPTEENYKTIPPCLRPSFLQLSTPHEPSIDWIPYPGLRDFLIANNYSGHRLDEITKDLTQSYTVEFPMYPGLPNHDGKTFCNLLNTSNALINTVNSCIVDFGIDFDFKILEVRVAAESKPSWPDIPSRSDNQHDPLTATKLVKMWNINGKLEMLKIDQKFFAFHPEICTDNLMNAYASNNLTPDYNNPKEYLKIIERRQSPATRLVN